jgi:sugar O-acyltransferase (sialic acid O-acetyltransferase NeuD family)
MERNMDGIWIIGYRDFGFEVADAAEEAGYEIAGYVDYDTGEKQEEHREAPVVPLDEITPGSIDRFVCAMTSTLLRQSLVGRIAALSGESAMPASVIHPSATVSKNAKTASGTLVMAGSVIASGASLGQWNLMNRGATIGHHTHLGDFCTIGPGVNIGGNCTIGRNAYIGIGATVLNYIRIGSHSLVAAGAVVTKNVPDHSLVMGVPARIVKSDFPGR